MGAIGMSPDILVLVSFGFIFLVAGAAWFMLYWLFQRVYGRKLRYETPVKRDLVFCGMEAPEEDVMIPVTEVMTSVLSRAVRRWYRVIKEGAAVEFVQDWYFFLIVMLVVILSVGVALGW